MADDEDQSDFDSEPEEGEYEEPDNQVANAFIESADAQRRYHLSPPSYHIHIHILSFIIKQILYRLQHQPTEQLSPNNFYRTTVRRSFIQI